MILRTLRSGVTEIDSLDTPLEILSFSAFQEGIRTSIANDMNFTYWLPLCTIFFFLT